MAKGRGADLHLGWGQEKGIAMKGAQSKVKWGCGSMGGGHGVNGGHGPHPIVTPLGWDVKVVHPFHFSFHHNGLI